MIHALPPDPPPIVGRVSVIDGDTLEIRGQRIRLWGIDAPEGRQTCTRAGEAYRCGTEAAMALDAIVAGHVLTCNRVGRPDRYRRIVARCTFTAGILRGGPHDVGAWMVGRGWAVDFPRYSLGAYRNDQAYAQERRSGMWAGEFQMPWEWRGGALLR